jgi:predicted GH43/DUF377 family glycosyl hydrolase
MPPPSVFHQGVTVTAVPAWSLVPSPRNYNSSVIEFDGRRLMAYRSHRMDQGGRCGIVICGLNEKWEATNNCWLNLPEQVASALVHHEDPRLFVFNGRLHVAYTESQFHAAPRPYTCVMKYARLKEAGQGRGKTKAWQIDKVFWPRYGKNDGSNQEKNWQFFEAKKGRLHVIYRGEPHTVLELGPDGETIANIYVAPAGTRWPWGAIRGGTPPIRMADGRWLTFFHSSTAYPFPPHWRRYYAGAYVFEPEAPFKVVAISQRPLLTGSEADGHGFDPRNIDSWKPFVVFPSGIMGIRRRGQPHAWAVSYGINDHMTAIAEHHDLALGSPDFSVWGVRYFFAENGSTPVRMFMEEDQRPVFIKWERTKLVAGGQCNGVMAVTSPRLALQLQETGNGIEEISSEQYQALRILP